MNKDLSNQSEKFIETYDNYNMLMEEIYQLTSILNKKNSKIKNVQNQMYNLCNHNWVMDDPQYQTPTSWTCSICGNYK